MLEIIQSRGHGKAVDWWALGILIFEMLAGYPPFYDDTPFGIYEKILEGKFEFPPFFSLEACDLIKGLLSTDLSFRLGNLEGGASDVQNHPLFAGINWQDVMYKKLEPPIVPISSGPGDSRNFEQYSEALPSDDSGISLLQLDHYFAGF